MKKTSYLTLFLLLFGYLGFGQSYEVQIIEQSTGNGLPNVSVFKTFVNSSEYIGDTDANGNLTFFDSINANLNIIAYDCNGNIYQDSLFAGMNPAGYDSLWFFMPCNYSLNCNVNIQDSLSGGTTYSLTDFGYSNVSNFTVRYDYTFGDGNWGSYYSPTVYHTYAAAGTYNWSCIRYVYDSINNIYGFCNDTIFGTIVVGGTPPAISCNASYVVDTSNSLLNTAVIWNTSTPTYNDPNYTTTYNWDFGDGNTSTQPFPTHTYTNIGWYQICLTVYTTDGTDSCLSTYCDSLGMDANGNLLYKGNSTGFTLNVMDPNAIGLDENPLNDFALYPNPANSQITLSSLNVSDNQEVQFVLSDLSGRQLKLGNVKPNSELTIDVSSYPSGMYLLHLSGKKAHRTMKIQITH